MANKAMKNVKQLLPTWLQVFSRCVSRAAVECDQRMLHTRNPALTSRTQVQAAGCPLQQTHTHCQLQALDSDGYNCIGNVQLARSLTHIAGFSHAQEQLQILQRPGFTHQLPYYQNLIDND
jgi:hypothetical protein